MESEYIFVYGSLRRGSSSPVRGVLDNYAEYVGEATFRGNLFEIDWYPGVVPSKDENDIVYGEIYKMIDSEKVLSELDRYEGCSPANSKPHAFVRKERIVKLKEGKELNAWIYLYNQSTSGKKRIPSGDFVIFKNRT